MKKRAIPMHYLLSIFLLCFLTSCYRMPEEGEVSVVPNVNNPQYNKKNSAQGAVMPSFDY